MKTVNEWDDMQQEWVSQLFKADTDTFRSLRVLFFCISSDDDDQYARWSSIKVHVLSSPQEFKKTLRNFHRESVIPRSGDS